MFVSTVKFFVSTLVSTVVGTLMEDDTENDDFSGHFRVHLGEHSHVHFREHSRGSVRGSNSAFACSVLLLSKPSALPQNGRQTENSVGEKQTQRAQRLKKISGSPSGTEIFQRESYRPASVT